MRKTTYPVNPIIFVAIALFSLIAPPAKAQVISTVVGNGTGAYGGDGGPATLAELGQPRGVVFDTHGNLFIDDDWNNRIRKVSPSGVITLVAGNGATSFGGDGGPATAAAMNGPGPCVVDALGNVYIADYYNYRIRKVNTAGIITTYAGNGGAGFTGDGGAATAAAIDFPWGVAVDAAGNLYIGAQASNRIRKVSPSGIITNFAGTGTPGFSGDGGAATAAELNIPNGLTVDGAGNVYIADVGNSRIRKVTPAGIISTIAGNGTAGWAGDGFAATSAKINLPYSIAVDAAGNVYIADNGNNVIRKINTSGIISTYAGNGTVGFSGDGGPATAAELNYPYSVAVDSAGHVFIADSYNNRIRAVMPGGDHAPVFVGGHTQSLTVCISESDPAVPINALLAASDSDLGQPESWSLSMPPSHGTVAATYAATSTGGTILPTGLTYTPALFYLGSDMFQVSVSDGIATDVTTINVSVNEVPSAGIISGTDTVCPGRTVALSETVSGGIWSSSNTAISTVNSSGIAMGVVPGNDTVIYTIINSCGIVSAIFPFVVSSYSACRTEVEGLPGAAIAGLHLYPNPSEGTFSITLTSGIDEQAQITITNVIGEKVLELNTTTNKETSLTLDKPAGVYFISARTANERYNGKLLLAK